MTTALTKEQTRAYAMIPEVKANHRECIKSGNETLKYAMQAGDLLNKMKPLIAHGEWEDIVGKCGFEIRIAQGYMKLARELPAIVDAKGRSELGIKGGLKLIAEHKKGGDQEPPKAKPVSLLKSTSTEQTSTCENDKKPDPHQGSGDRQQADQPVEPNECPPGKHKWNDEDDCDVCHVARSVAEPPPPPPTESPVKAMFVDLLEHVRQCVLLIDRINNATDKKHGQLHESVMNSLDCAGIDAKKWRGLCK